MNLTDKEKDDITDDVIESRDVEEDDLTTVYLKGYADAEEKYRKKIKDKIEKYNKKMTEDTGHPNWVVTDRIVMNVLEELLEDK